MHEDDINHRFNYHPAATPARRDAHEQIRGNARALAHILNHRLPEGREKSTAITKLEEAMFWANAAIARQPAEEPVDQACASSQALHNDPIPVGTRVRVTDGPGLGPIRGRLGVVTEVDPLDSFPLKVSLDGFLRRRGLRENEVEVIEEPVLRVGARIRVTAVDASEHGRTGQIADVVRVADDGRPFGVSVRFLNGKRMAFSKAEIEVIG